MKLQLVRSKLHRATCGGGNLNYRGSITIGANMLRAARMVPFEVVHVNNINTGFHWETYVIPGPDGAVVLNGAPARHFQQGDKVVIMAMAWIDPAVDLESFEHRVVYLDDANNIIETRVEGYDPQADWHV